MRAAESGIDYAVLEFDEDHIKATAFNMLFMIWRRRTLAEAYRRGIQVVGELSVSYPEGIGVLQLVEVDAVPPAPTAREAFREMLALHGIGHYSVTHEGTGLKAAAVRAIALGGQALARPNFPHSVHGSLAGAAAWHAGMQRGLGHDEPAAEIQRIAQDLRDRHRERFPA